MSVSAEVEINRRNTLAFIAASPTAIVLRPRIRSKDAYGVHWVYGPDRPSQAFRIIDQSGTVSATQALQRAEDGTQRQVSFMLLGAYDAQIGLYDVWTDTQGNSWQVTDLLPYNGYERRASVIKFGEY